MKKIIRDNNMFNEQYAKACITHSTMRLLKRASIIVDDLDLFILVEQILEGVWPILKRRSTNQTFYKIKIKGKTMVVLFNETLMVPQTFITTKMYLKRSI